jgi:cell division protein FtsA
LAVKLRIAAGLDVGSASVRCVAGVIEDGRLRFAGAGEAASRGWLRGKIVDQDQAAESIREAVREAEMNAHFSIESVAVGVGGSGVEGVNSWASYSIGRARELVPEDLRYTMELASRLTLPTDRLVLQVCPQDFVVDGHSGQRFPRGLMCSRLEAHAHLITARVYDHQSLVSTVHRAHLAVEDTVYEPFAAAFVSLLPDDRNRGLALVDIGVSSSDMVVYDGDSLMHTAGIPVSGDHFTNDIAKVMTLAYDDAERLKTEFGCAILGLTADNTMIQVPAQEGRPPRDLSRKLLNQILEARAEELFRLVRYELKRAELDGKLIEGLVLTGGGAEMHGILPAAERVLNMRARHATPIAMEHWPSRLNPNWWTTAAGLCLYSARWRTRQDKPRRRSPFV